jgi:hypothetical protein
MVASCADILPLMARRGIVPDLLTDQASAHDPLNGYVPNGMTLEEAIARRRNPVDGPADAARDRAGGAGDRLRVEDELKLLRVISRLKPIRCVPTFLGAHETPEEYRGRKRDYVDLVVRRSCPRWRASSSPNTATYFASEAFSISMALVGFSMRRDPPVSVCECTPTSSLMLAAGG